MLKKVWIVFLLLSINFSVYGMRKLAKKIQTKCKKKPKHDSDKKRDLRKPWMCECEMCTDQLIAERESEEAWLSKREPDTLATTPEDYAEHARRLQDQVRRLEAIREERRWKLCLAAERVLMEYAERDRASEYTGMPNNDEKPKRKWEITPGIVMSQVPKPEPKGTYFYSSEDRRNIGNYLLESPEPDRNDRMRMSFSDEDVLN